jgi:hypothetical protein
MRKLPVAIALGVLALSSSAWAVAAPHLIVAQPSFSCFETEAVSQVITTFSDTFPSPTTFTADIDWGDGTHTTPIISPRPTSAPGTYDVFGSHTYSDEGSYSVLVTVHDDSNAVDGDTSQEAKPITCADTDELEPSPTTQPSIEPRQYQAFSGVVATFSDSNTTTTAGDLTAIIDWGDGSPPTAGTVSGGAGTFTVSGTHTWLGPVPSNFPSASVGSVGVTLSESAPGTAESEASVPVILDNAIQFSSITSTLAEGAVPGAVATFSDAVTSHTAGDFTAEACFCDTFSCTPAIVQGGSGSFTVYATVGRPVDEGAFDCVFVDVHTNVDVVSQASASLENDEVTVVDAPIAPSPKVIQAQPNVAWSGNAGGIFDANQFSTTADYDSVSIDWGDGSAADLTGTVVHNGTPGYFAIMGTHTWVSPGPYTVAVTVHDVGGQSVTVKSQATVLDTSITVKGVTNTVAVNIASNLTVASFSLKDLTGASTDFTAKVDWGDGSTNDAGKVLGARGDFRVTGTHTYASPGPHTTTITVADTRAGGGTGKGSGESDVTGGGISVDVPGSIQEYAGVAFKWTFHVEDPTASDTTSTYKINVSWGDSTTDTAADITAGSGGGFDVSAGHTYAMVGMDTITVTVTNAASGQVVATVHVSVDVVTEPADGGTNGSTTSGSGSSGGCSMSGAPTSNLGALLLACLIVGILVSRRRRAH